MALACAALAAAPAAMADVEVTVSASDATAREAPPDNGEFLIRRIGGNQAQPVALFYLVSGTATPGADYAALSGNVSLAANQQEARVAVNVSGDDGLFEGDETVNIRVLGSLIGGITVTGATATVTVVDSEYAVTAASGANASEGSLTNGEIVVSLSGQNASGDTLTVDYSVAGSAEAGADYEPLDGVALIPNGSSSTVIDIEPLADDVLEGNETVQVTLTGTSDPRAPVGEPATASTSIIDDEGAADDDDDGLSNIEECPDVDDCRDTDGDSVPDWQDPDDDGDGVPTASENPPSQDTDSNDVPDYLDDNDDGDLRLTRDEDLDEDGDGNPATDPTDLDDDDIPDYLDPDDQGGPTGDLDGDGLTNEREAELGTDPENPDTDGDGVDDGAEDEAGTDPLDHLSFEDADGDLVPDVIETSDGSDPGDADSYVDSDGGGTADHIETVTYASFGIDASDPQDFSDDQRDFDGDGLPDRLEIGIGGAPDDSESPTSNGADDDSSNGVTNAVEDWLATLGISPIGAVSDFDRDGYPDAAEIAFGLSPLRATTRDSDGDGVPDIIELKAGADIDATTDSDADGVPDARELATGSDPLDAGSPVANGQLDDDGDGVSNAVEHVLQALGGLDDTAADSDDDGDGLGDADEIRLGTDPFHDEQPVPWIELVQANFGPVRAVSTDGGTATARAVVGGHQSGTQYDWAGTDNAVLAVTSGEQTASTLTFSPETLPPGTYNLVLRVRRTAGDFSSPDSVLQFTLAVLAAADAADLADSDNDGIPDDGDNFDAHLGFANFLQARPGGESAPLIHGAPGVRLQVGSTARTSQANSAQVSVADIAAAGDGQGGSVGNSEDPFDYRGGIYDYEVTNLPQAGATVQIVIPQATAIGEFPEFRKFLPGRGWGVFIEDANNSIASAAGSSGECPEPGDDAYQSGLTTGHFCVQLSVEDGGPNDADAAEGPNGVIKDPGGVATPKGEVVAGSGGGGFSPAALLALGLFSIVSLRRRRRLAGAAVMISLLGCGLLLAVPSTADADAFVGVGGGASFLDPDTGQTPFRVKDDQDVGYKVFAGFDLGPVSRNLSVEAFWADLGEATLNGNGKVDYSLYGAGLSYGIGSVRAPRLSAFVEAGVARLDAKANVPLRQEDDTLMFFGVAGSFAIRRHWFLQLEYEYFAEDAQFVSLSIVKRFRGRRPTDARTIPLPDRPREP